MQVTILGDEIHSILFFFGPPDVHFIRDGRMNHSSIQALNLAQIASEEHIVQQLPEIAVRDQVGSTKDKKSAGFRLLQDNFPYLLR